jgi:two-component system cell cycle response regulator DivK
MAQVAKAEREAEPRNRVLVVDDSPEMLDAVRCSLEPCGFHVMQASDPFTGIRLAATEHPDAIVMDLDMPGMDGTEAVKYLKRIEQTRGIPVIAFTGQVLLRPERLTDRGFDGVVAKGDSFDALESELRRVM